jgi:hypothetical protein
MSPPSSVNATHRDRPADVADRHEGCRQALLLSVSFVVCFALQAATSVGQTVGAITGAINGTVTDTTGALLPGVTVEASSDAVIGNRGTRTTLTNAQGLYRFSAVAPGEYRLVFTLDGFMTLAHERIYVGVGLTATIDVELHIQTLHEEVTVERNAPVIDRQSAAIATFFDARQLASLPSARSMWAIQAATPAVYLPRFDLGASATSLGGSISAYGTVGFNRPMVEGISVSGINPTGFTLTMARSKRCRLARPRTGRSGLGQACKCSSSASREEISIAARSTLTT